MKIQLLSFCCHTTPAFKGHPRDQAKVSLYDRCPLVREGAKCKLGAHIYANRSGNGSNLKQFDPLRLPTPGGGVYRVNNSKVREIS